MEKTEEERRDDMMEWKAARVLSLGSAALQAGSRPLMTHKMTLGETGGIQHFYGPSSTSEKKKNLPQHMNRSQEVNNFKVPVRLSDTFPEPTCLALFSNLPSAAHLFFIRTERFLKLFADLMKDGCMFKSKY